MDKTNVMRILDKKKVVYTPHEYPRDVTDGEQVAALLGQNPASVFKTLVTEGHGREFLVFVIPVNKTLDLKKAARAAGVKNVEMIKQKELLPLTGYIHGGCSPIGMKKQFRTFLDATAAQFETIFFSAGKVGMQVETSPQNLASVIPLNYADLTRDE